MTPYLVAAPAALALAMTAFNLLTWPVGRPGRRVGAVSVLIPARDEAETIERAVRAACACPEVREVVVYDDGSVDATPAILARLAAELPALRVARGGPLPAGWVGKPHACQRLGEAATGDVLLFVDADVALRADGVARMLDLLDRYDAGVVTALPLQVMGSAVERLVLPLLTLTYTSWLPLPLIWWSRDPRFLAANGQLLAVRRGAWDTIGGFASVRDQIVDDMAFCGRAKRVGERVVFADGAQVATCRMYADAASVVRGFSKNLYLGLGGSPFALAAVVALYLWAFVAPYGLLVASVWQPSLLVPAAVGVAANVLVRVALASRFAHPWSGVAAHPVGVLVLVGIAMNSWWWSVRGRVEWRGRAYGHAAGPWLTPPPRAAEPIPAVSGFAADRAPLPLSALPAVASVRPTSSDEPTSPLVGAGPWLTPPPRAAEPIPAVSGFAADRAPLPLSALSAVASVRPTSSDEPTSPLVGAGRAP